MTTSPKPRRAGKTPVVVVKAAKKKSAVSSTNRAAVDSLVASLRRERALDTLDEALGRLALTLAEVLDAGAGMATAAVSRELRATLASLVREEVTPDEDDPIFGVDLPAQVRNPTES